MAEKKYLTQAGLERIFGVVRQWDNNTNAALDAHKTALTATKGDPIHIAAGERAKWNNAATFVTNITGEDTDNVINKWDEVVKFFENSSESDRLATMLTDISGLKTSVAGKADAIHTHTMSAITGLQTALDAKLNKTDLVAFTNAEIDDAAINAAPVMLQNQVS